MFKRKWKEVFERSPHEVAAKSVSSGSVSDTRVFREAVLKLLEGRCCLQGRSWVCEIGCGCGDKLSFFYERGHDCFGIDYSSNAIRRAKEEMPGAQLFVADASRLPFDDACMDFVYAYSVFMYFEGEKKKKKVLDEIYRVAKDEATICIWDVPDIRQREKVLRMRGGHEEGLEHTYYDPADFVAWAEERGVRSIKTEYFNFPGHRYGPYRFNITMYLEKAKKNLRNGGSSNGRTDDSGSSSPGSNPGPPANSEVRQSFF